MRIKGHQLECGDCLEVMKTIPDKSVDMVLCDLPYGTTHNRWDSILDLETLWTIYNRVLVPYGSVVLTAAQPFTSSLVDSNRNWFQYSLVWEKNIATGHMDARRRPMRKHEDVLVFSPISYQNTGAVYNPQMSSGDPYINKRNGVRGQKDNGSNYGKWRGVRTDTNNTGSRYPVSVIRFDREIGLHPTQKPVSLFEYLIRTYTNPGDTVLDNCCGSGTTGVSCVNMGRLSIQIELSPDYYAIARDRLYEALSAKENANA